MNHKNVDQHKIIRTFPDQLAKGIRMVVFLKRRIENALLTTYLPTMLILLIVYVTNFFKPFFFESVISVNLTALLVLTTLFISVSGGLPPTAYVKMVDIWLIFAQLIPFCEVILHTFMYMMRTEGSDDEEEGREINHHGKKIIVGPDGKHIQKPKEVKEHGIDLVKCSLYINIWKSANVSGSYPYKGRQ